MDQQQPAAKKTILIRTLIGSFILFNKECTALTTRLQPKNQNNGVLSGGNRNIMISQKVDSKLNLKMHSVDDLMEWDENTKSCSVCPEEDDGDSMMSRREWTFATFGTLWSMGLVPNMILPEALQSQPANAAFGTDAKMQLPNVMESISNRVNKQCLAESLGNRECLVYQSDNPLYKGENDWANRLIQAAQALETIPSYVEKKQWSAVLGVTTGPMGGLSVTLDQLAKANDNQEALKSAKRVKSDLYEIAAAVERKNGDVILEAHAKATKDLNSFINSL